MQTFINEQSKTCELTITETSVVKGDLVVDISQINAVLSALAVLGKLVISISVYKLHADFDTTFYHRFPDAVLAKLGSVYRQSDFVPVKYKNGRLYMYIEVQDGTYEIILPRDVRSNSYSEPPQLTLVLKWY